MNSINPIIISLYQFRKWQIKYETISHYINGIINGTHKYVEINIPFIKSHPNAKKIRKWIYRDYYDKNIMLNYLPNSEALKFHEDLWMLFYLGKMCTNFKDIFCYYIEIFARRICILSYLTPHGHLINSRFEFRYISFKKYDPKPIYISEIGHHYLKYFWCRDGYHEICRYHKMQMYYSNDDELITHIVRNIKIHMALSPRGQSFIYKIQLDVKNYSENDKFISIHIKKIQSEFLQYDISHHRLGLYIQPNFIIVPDIISEYVIEYYGSNLALCYHITDNPLDDNSIFND